MENWVATLSIIVVLIVGIAAGFVLDKPEEVTKEVEVIKEVAVPAECPEEVVCEETTVVDVGAVVDKSIRDAALSEFLMAVDDEEDEAGEDVKILACGSTEFDFDEISVSKVFDEWSVVFDDEETTVDFKVRMKYKETDEKSCRQTFEVRVHYEDDEDTKVTDWGGQPLLTVS